MSNKKNKYLGLTPLKTEGRMYHNDPVVQEIIEEYYRLKDEVASLQQEAVYHRSALIIAKDRTLDLLHDHIELSAAYERARALEDRPDDLIKALKKELRNEEQRAAHLQNENDMLKGKLEVYEPHGDLWMSKDSKSWRRAFDVIKEQDEQIADMRRALHDIYEVYAGSEGFKPVTCAEGYLQERVKEMADIAAKYKK